MYRTITLLLALFTSSVQAHEMTPTYFNMKPSLYTNVFVTQMRLFNRREDVKFYEISVYDDDWDPIKFASKARIVQIDPLKGSTFEVYVRRQDLDDVVYICTESKLLKGEVESTGITSRICSKRKE